MMISFYLAYLSAHFVTAKAEDNDQDLPISSVEDLAYQSEISYGTVFAGSSGHVFRVSKPYNILFNNKYKLFLTTLGLFQPSLSTVKFQRLISQF